MIGYGQNVNIPDANFKAYLVGNSAINTNGDSEIQLSEAHSFNGSIVCDNLNISDLTGIEDFIALETLYCGNNQLTSLNLSNNISLANLGCSNNQLIFLDLSSLINLLELDVCYNNLTTLNVIHMNLLANLWCTENQLTTIDISQNNQLYKVFCSNNQLTSLNLKNGNNIQIMRLWCNNNPNLTCITVDDAAWSTTNWTDTNYYDIDPQHYFSNNCSGTTSIQELATNKELLKVIDLLGRETKQTNQPLFYIFDDGTVEKRIVIE